MSANKIFYFLLLFSQVYFGQTTANNNYNNAKEAYFSANFTDALLHIKDAKEQYKSSPPKVSYLEIMICAELLKIDPYQDYSLLDETRILVNDYLKKYQKINIANYKSVKQVANKLDTLPQDLFDFNAAKEDIRKKSELAKKRDEIALAREKDRIELEEKAKKLRDSILRKEAIEEEILNNLILERKIKLEPYIKAITISDHELGGLSDINFNNRFNKAKQDLIKIENEEARIEDLRIKRYNELEKYSSSVSNYELSQLGAITDARFAEIYKQAKHNFKEAKRIKKPKLNSFSSLGFQSGEIATYGLLYERGGRRAIGFRMSARTSLIDEEDLLNGTVTQNKTEIELGPNIKISNRFYLNIGGGYGYYDKIINNDYNGSINLEKTTYYVATTGLMIRMSRVININGGVSFIDIDKDIYKPEITFGISFNLRGKYRS